MGNANTCFSVSIQAPGFGSARRIQGANDSEQIGQRQAEPERGENRQRNDRRLGQRGADRGRHERRRAGRRHQRGQARR